MIDKFAFLEGTLFNMFLFLGFTLFIYILYMRYVYPVEIYKHSLESTSLNSSSPQTKHSKNDNKVAAFVRGSKDYRGTLSDFYRTEGFEVTEHGENMGPLAGGVDIVLKKDDSTILVKTVDSSSQAISGEEILKFSRDCENFIDVRKDKKDPSFEATLLSLKTKNMNIKHEVISLEKAVMGAYKNIIDS